MQCSESRKEAARLTPVMTPRTTARVATWNISMMYETGKTTIQVAREMKNYMIGLLEMNETRWLQSGLLRLSSVLRTHRGRNPPPFPHIEGVALMLALIGWEPVNSRIFTAKKKDLRLNITQCYAPTNGAEKEKKDDFYQQLQAVLDRRRAKDITILMGDYIAKIGMDNTGYEDIMGTHGQGQMNGNDERFADLCALPTLAHPQGHMDISEPRHGEPDRPHMH